MSLLSPLRELTSLGYVILKINYFLNVITVISFIKALINTFTFASEFNLLLEYEVVFGYEALLKKVLIALNIAEFV